MQANYSMQHKNMGEHFGSLDTPESEERERSVGGGSASGLNPKLMTAAHLSQRCCQCSFGGLERVFRSQIRFLQENCMMRGMLQTLIDPLECFSLLQ